MKSAVNRTVLFLHLGIGTDLVKRRVILQGKEANNKIP